MTSAQSYPVQRLVFFVAQDLDDAIRREIPRFVEALAASRSWVIGPPRPIDDVDPPDDPSVDLPIETLGGELEIYSALGPVRLPREIDLRHLEEVTSLVEAVKKLSKDTGLTFDFELDGTYVGAVSDGKADRTLQVGLLDEWRRHLQAGG